jgi:hypothetical protein
MFVLKQIAEQEGASAFRAVPGLEKALRRYAAANQLTWRGWYLRNVKGVESDLPHECRSRAILQRLRSMKAELA